MNKYFILAILCFIAGAGLFGYDISRGQGNVYWVLIIPVIQGSGIFSMLGILCIIAGMILLMFSFSGGAFELAGWEELYPEDEEPYPYQRHEPKAKQIGRPPGTGPGTRSSAYNPSQRTAQKPRSSIRTGGVIFIGPIPIIWGSDKKIAYIMALVSVVLVIIFLVYIFVNL